MNDSDTHGHSDDKAKYPYIRPKDLNPAERLAVDAEDVEDFVEHFTNHDEHEKAHREERAKKLEAQRRAAAGESTEG